MLKTFQQWLSGATSSTTAPDSVRKVVGRFARGNVLLQRGRYVTDASGIIAKGDRALRKLDRLAHK